MSCDTWDDENKTESQLFSVSDYFLTRYGCTAGKFLKVFLNVFMG